MSTIRRFEDIESWKKARVLASEVYRLTRTGEFAKDFGLKDQMRRAVVSVTSNIAEGFERDGTREFIQHLSHAKGSIGELRSQFYIALDAGYLSSDETDRLQGICIEVARLISGMMTYLNQCEIKGVKFRS